MIASAWDPDVAATAAAGLNHMVDQLMLRRRWCLDLEMVWFRMYLRWTVALLSLMWILSTKHLRGVVTHGLLHSTRNLPRREPPEVSLLEVKEMARLRHKRIQQRHCSVRR